MGRYGNFTTRAEVEREFAAGLTHHAWTREHGEQVLWAVATIERPGQPTLRVVACFAWDGRMVKPMDETFGPYFWSCPLSTLNAATSDPGAESLGMCSEDWRRRVRIVAAGGRVYGDTRGNIIEQPASGAVLP